MSRKTRLLPIILLFAWVMAGCGTAPTATQQALRTAPGSQASGTRAEVSMRAIEVSYDELLAKKTISQQVEISHPGSLVVTLGANPSTGFQWQADAAISDPTVLVQGAHRFEVPEARGMVGVPGRDVWTFNALKAGHAVIRMSYGRPWAGGEKDAWTCTLDVTVRYAAEAVRERELPLASER